MIKIAQLLLKKNEIFFDKEEFAFQVESHPSYPSLHALTGVYTHFNIENVAATVPVDKETLVQLPTTFIAQINGDKGLELVLIEKKKSNILIAGDEDEKTIDEDNFLKQFTGIVLAVEKDENSENEKTKTNNTLLHILVMLLFGGLILSLNYDVFVLSYLLLSIAGVMISLSILNQEVGINNSINNLFCSSKDEKKDCDAVLTSNGANIIKNHKLSDLSFIYFLGLLLTQFIFIMQSSTTSLLYVISLASLPITLYSIYYQYAVVKKWCFLCLSIVAILWLQGSVFFIKSPEIVFSLESVLTILFGFLLGYSIWNYTKPRFTQFFDLKKIKIAHFKFKRNFNLFNSLLEKDEPVDTNIGTSSEIVFGNRVSDLEIVIITNPFCGHCKPVHHQIENILKTYSDEVKIVIRFNVGLDDPKSDAAEITSRLLEIHHKDGDQKCLEAMHDAYGDLSPTKWFEKWKKTDNQEPYIEVLKQTRDWCTEKKINFTPEILIGGRSFPKEYDRADLIYFIEELSEEFSSSEEL